MGFLFFAVCLCLLGGKTVYGEQKTKCVEISKLDKTANGGVLSIKNAENNGQEIRYSTKGEGEGYYTAFYAYNGDIQITPKDVITFHIKAKTDIRMNINLIKQDNGKSYQLGDGELVFAKDDSDNKYEVIPVEYGTFTIQKGFKGTVYIPQKLDNTEKVSVGNIGFIVVQTEDALTEFLFSSLGLVDGFGLKNEPFFEHFEINGQGEVEIPVTGDYYYDYELKIEQTGNEKPSVAFVLEKDYKGITMDENGRLTVTDKAKPQTLKISIVINENFYYRYVVKIKESWMKKEKNPVVLELMVPKPEEVKKIEHKVYVDDKKVQAGCLALLGCFLLFYQLYVRKK